MTNLILYYILIAYSEDVYSLRSDNLNRSGRFLEACILCILKENETYGYSLLERLIQNEFIDKNTNISIIYRTLRSMERDGLVISKWQESDQGPKKRLYNITVKGNKELDNLIILLKSRRLCIDMVIDIYDGLNKK